MSKLISDKWKKEPLHVKSYWDKIAEREKLKETRISGEYNGRIDISISMSTVNDFNSITFVNSTINNKTNFSHSFDNCTMSTIPESSNFSVDPFLPLTDPLSDEFNLPGENFMSSDSSTDVPSSYLPLPPLFLNE
ncbi:23081_t:CDS:1 [Cetraspora pellucida]|uniref:23081_t:CDS:1 n=1 Tax=Cetraspora pellucida TaxID=1433469 RepID=A0A9N8VLF2_9GLOM|nr:23081_t:CDS:1 [Cetraspora pellucida]